MATKASEPKPLHWNKTGNGAVCGAGQGSVSVGSRAKVTCPRCLEAIARQVLIEGQRK